MRDATVGQFLKTGLNTMNKSYTCTCMVEQEVNLNVPHLPICVIHQIYLQYTWISILRLKTTFQLY